MIDLKQIEQDLKDGVYYGLANDTIRELLDEIKRLRKVHTEEQGRAADRLREALART